MKKLVLFVAVLTFVLMSCNGNKNEEAAKMSAQDKKLCELQKEIDKFVPVNLEFDKTLINDNQKQVLLHLIEAAKLMDEIFLRQVYSKNVILRDKLSKGTTELEKKEYELFDLFKGPFNRLDHNKPFIEGVGPKPLGANFYPEDMTKEEFNEYLKLNPKKVKDFESSFTVIKRVEGDLVAIPYSEEYKEFLVKAAEHLKKAAEISKNKSVKDYLEKRAKAFLTNDYFESDMAWMDMKDNAIEVVIGPYEVYEDELFGYKAAFEAFVNVKDPVESQKLEMVAKYLVDMEKNLPIEDKYKNFNRGNSSPIAVVYEVFSGGDTKAGVQTTAYNLPNDERVREAKGSKKVMLKNVAKAKFDKILTPIVKIAMDDSVVKQTSFNAFFTHTLLHEMSHGIGPGIITVNGKKTSVNRELKDLYSTIEEAKADTLGVYNGFFLVDKGEFEQGFDLELVSTFIGGIFRSVRFGINEAHGGANAIIFNYLQDEGVIVYDGNAEKFSINLDKAKAGFTKLAKELLMIEALGDYKKAQDFVEKYVVIRPEMKKVLDKLESVPVDIKPIFPKI